MHIRYAFLCLQNHEKKVEERQQVLRSLHHNVRGRDNENSALDSELTDLNVTTNERRHIYEVNSTYMYIITYLLNADEH